MRHPWNYDLTKDTDERVSRIAETRSLNHRGYKEVVTKTILCKNCEKELIVSEKSDQKFCSKKCTTTWHHSNEPDKFYKWIKEEPKKFIEHNRKVGISQRGVSEKDWVKKQISKIMKDFYVLNPNNLEAFINQGIKNNADRWLDPKQHQLHSKKMLQLWSDTEYKNNTIRKMMSSNGKKLNKKEEKLFEIIEGLFPSKFFFVGDGKVIINGKVPDFINGKKQIIELFGDYWHKGENTEDRISIFKELDYDCLVIWEHELKIDNRDKLLNKITNFVKVEA